MSVVKVWNLNNDFRYNAAFLDQGDLSRLSVHLLYICSTRLYDPLMRLVVLLFRFKVLQNTTWFGLAGLKGNVMKVLCIDVINIISKTRASYFIKVSNIEKQLLLFRGVWSP